MLPTIARIFISSTWLDLQPERQAIEDAINRMSSGKFISMEYFGSRPEGAEQISLVEVDNADIFIGIIGGRYGSGITEAEYQRARQRGLPCFIYFKDEKAISAEGRDKEPERSARLAAFKESLSKHHIITFPFTMPGDLAICVRDDLYRWFDQRRAAKFAAVAVGNIVTTRDDQRPVRLQVGAAEGVLVYDGALAQPRPRPTPVRPSVRPFLELLDRTAESDAAVKALQESSPVEFYGQAGIGKTALLRHLAYHTANGDFPDGVIYLEQVGQRPVADLLQFLFDSFYERAPGYKPREAELLNLLRGKRALALLDDVELPRAEIERVLNAAPECAFLLSSEERNLFGEGRALQLPGLPEPEAAQLLERELGRPLAPEEQSAAQTICAMLAGHPLHIAQTAALLRECNLSLGEFATQMQATQARGKSPAELLNRQMAAALSNDEKRAMAALAALDGAPALAKNLAAISGVSNVEATLDKLAQRKLVETRAAGYRLTGSLQTILSKDWDLTEWRARALAYFTTWAEAQRRDHPRIEESSAALLAIFNWALRNGRWDEAKRLGKALEGALILSGRWEAWGQVLQQTGQAAAAIGDEETAAWVLHQQGTRALCLGADDAARRSLTEALERRAAMGDHAAASATRHNLDWLFPPVPFTAPGSAVAPAPSGRPIPGWLKIIGAALLAGLGGWLFWPEAKPQFSPAQLSFPSQPLNQPSAQQTVTLTNPGPKELTIDELRIEGAAAGDFAIAGDDCRGKRLARGEKCSVSLIFTPRAADAREAILKLIGRPSELLPELMMSGVAVAIPPPSPTVSPAPTVSPTGASMPTPPPAPRLEASRGEMPFGTRQVRTSSGDSLTLTNRGAADLMISGVTINGPHRGDFSAANGCAQRTIRPGDACAINVTFTPSAEGERSATLIISSNDAGSPLSVSLTGSGVLPPPDPPEIQPNSLNFGRVELGRSAAQSATLTNVSEAPLRIGDASLTGDQLGEFKLEQNGCQAKVLPRGGQCAIRVAFTPQTSGSRGATLVIADNTPARRQSVPLSGAGFKPSLPRADARPSQLGFNDQEIGGKEEEKSVTVISVGDAPLRIFNVRLEGSPVFRAVPEDCRNKSFAPKQSCTVRVLFAPKAAGSHRATMLIESDAADSPHRVEISGRVNAPVRRPKLSVSPTSHDFGSVAAGDKSKALTLRLRNADAAALRVGEITIVGDNPADFKLDWGCANSDIQPGKECRLKITFAPEASTGRADQDRVSAATLFIGHNADGDRAEVQLSGVAARRRP